MTNGEKLQKIFPNGVLTSGGNNSYYWGDDILVSKNWWNAEYKEPTTKNDLGVNTDNLISDCEKMSFDIEIFNKPLKVVAIDAVKNIVKDMEKKNEQMGSRI